MDPQKIGILDLYSMYVKVRAALAAGDLSTLAMIGGDLLHEAAKVLPTGKTTGPGVNVPAPGGDLQPLTLPSIGGILGWISAAETILAFAKKLFGK